MAQRQLYITGGIGSQSSGERSAAITICRMTRYTLKVAPHRPDDVCPTNAGNGRRQSICDVMERALYNTVLGGMALDGNISSM